MINLSETLGNYERMEIPSGDKVANYLTSSIQRLNARQHNFVSAVMGPLNNQTRFRARNIYLTGCETSINNLESYISAKHKVNYGLGHKLFKENVSIDKWTPCVFSKATFSYCPDLTGMTGKNLFFRLEISVTEIEKIERMYLSNFDEQFHNRLSRYLDVYYDYNIKLIDDLDEGILFSESFFHGKNDQLISETKQLINNMDAVWQQFGVIDRMYDVLDAEFQKRDALKKKKKN